MWEHIIDSFNELISTTKTYKTMGIRLSMITFLTFLTFLLTLFIHHSDVFIEVFLNKIGTHKGTNELSLPNVLLIESFLSSMNLPQGYILGIETIKATGIREILWVSNEETFKTLDKLDARILNRNPKRLQFAKGYAYLVGSCTISPSIPSSLTYNYYVCPIRVNGEVKGIVWLLYDTTDDEGLNLVSDIDPMLKEIRNLLETENGFN